MHPNNVCVCLLLSTASSLEETGLEAKVAALMPGPLAMQHGKQAAFFSGKKKAHTLRAKGTPISEPRFSTPCETQFSHARKEKRPFQRKTLDKARFPFLAWEKPHLAGGTKSGLTNWCAFGPQGKHKPFCPVGLGTTPGISPGLSGGTLSLGQIR